MFRAAKERITDGSRGTGQMSRDQLESGHGMSAGGSRNWDSFKGHQLDSDVGEQSSLHLRPSFDAIPLVTSAKPSSSAGDEGTGIVGIHKTMEVSVSSESYNVEKHRRGGGGSL